MIKKMNVETHTHTHTHTHWHEHPLSSVLGITKSHDATSQSKPKSSLRLQIP